jgi:hypothetical protein
MTKILVGYLIEKDTDALIIETARFSETDVKKIVDGINDISDKTSTYPYASAFSTALLHGVLKDDEPKHICTLRGQGIVETYFALKEAYRKNKYTERWIGFHILAFFDNAHCERDHIYLRFDLTII